jgi:O-antigen/teichoic acid export membrane protein
MICSVAYDVGIKALIVREVARNRHQVSIYYANLSTLKIILGVLGFLLIMAIATSAGYSGDVLPLFALIGVQYFFISVDDFHSAFFNAFEVRKLEASLRIVQKGLLALMGFLALYFAQSLWVLVLSSTAAALIATLWGILLMHNNIANITLRWDSAFVKTQMAEAWPFALSSIAVGLYFYVDSIILSLMTDESAVGYYNSAYRVLEACMIIPYAISGTMNPVLSRLAVHSLDRFKRAARFTFKILFGIGLTVALCGTILSTSIISFLYGESYSPAGRAFGILAWAILIIFLNTVVSVCLNALNRQRSWLMILSLAAVLNITANLFFIPVWGFLAAAIITVLTELLILIIMILVVQRSVGTFQFFSGLGPLTLCSILTGAVVYLFKELHLFFIIALGCFFYVIAVFIFRPFPHHESQLLMNILPVRLRFLFR